MNNNLILKRTPRLDVLDQTQMRANLREYFINTFDEYTRLFDALNCDEAFYKKSISLRHPLIFYFGHTATFFINKMLLSRLIDQRIDQNLESIFAVGVDEMSWDDLDDANYDWPSVNEVRNYRQKLRTLVLDVIDNSPLKTPINWHNPWWSIIMGIEHERIHLETSSVLIRQHDLKYIRHLDGWDVCPHTDKPLENHLLDVAAGKVNLGKNFDSPFYGWDNEYGSHTADVDAFKASKYLVSNHEYLEFMSAQGYEKLEYWTKEGQNWLQYSKRKHPEFWREKSDDWYLRLMTCEIPMPWDWPAEVNYLEAKAFCNWKSAKTGLPIRLPTEDEWNLLHSTTGLSANDPDGKWNANLHLDHWASSCPVNMFAHGDFYDVVGNVWQWSETPIYPFDGFEVHPYYDDFTMPTFDNKHNIILGGSWASAGNEAQLSSRYAFRRHFFQHAGFRYICSDAQVMLHSSNYETDTMLSEYAEFHYGDEYFDVPNFSKTLVETVLPYLDKNKMHRALDIGCAVGRASFELSRYFKHVTGIDFSARFINLGVQLVNDGVIRYAITDEGDIQLFKARTLKSLGLDKVNTPEFIQGDACNLKPNLNGFDLVFAANLIDRLYEPNKFLNDIHHRINSGGILLIASPYTWLEDHTPKQFWLGGFKKDGENYTTFDGLKETLSANFKLIATPNAVPFVIRETSHKFQHSLSQVTIWQRI